MSPRKDVMYYLDQIRDGGNKKLVESIRLELDKDKRDILKKKLKAVTFAGTFEARAMDKLKKASGLMVLDFDKVDDIFELKENIQAKTQCFACFISPSGNGLKAVFRIRIVDNSDCFRNIFNDLTDFFGWADIIDQSGKDITRLCFESYDPDLYLNDNAEIYQERQIKQPELEVDLGLITNIPIIDEDVIANKLINWFKSKFNPNERNTSLFKLAIAFNDFGVDKNLAYRYCYSFEQKGFGKKEIDNIIKSAYKHTANFGSKQFEDKVKRRRIENTILSGKKDEQIIEFFKDIPEAELKQEIEIIRENIRVDEFWKWCEDGKLRIIPYRLKIYLQNLNYYKYYPNDNQKTFVFIQKDDKFIDILTEYQIKDDILNRLVADNQIDAFNLMAEKTRVFTQNYLSMIDTAIIDIRRDGIDYAMLYYGNTAVKVYKDRVETIDYCEMEDFVWKNTVIDRDFANVDHHKSQFRSLIWYCSGECVDKYNTMKSVIGYLLHSYKTSNNNKAIILNDETISDCPNGGSGKGIIINAVAQMKKLSMIDGKTFDFNKSFAFQTVNTDTQVLAFDDVRKNFEFERLFSVITEGITIEYKGKDAIKIPVKDSPKIMISTNYTVKADGGSFQRRIFEVEMSDYFGVNRTPVDVFGNLLFDDWDKQEWEKFDKFMINCLQYYLTNGLVESKANNLPLRKFINETSQEFYEYSCQENQIDRNIRIIKSQFTHKLQEEYPDMKKWLTTRIAMKWVKKYCQLKNIEYTEGNSNGQRWFVVGDAPSVDEVENVVGQDCPY